MAVEASTIFSKQIKHTDREQILFNNHRLAQLGHQMQDLGHSHIKWLWCWCQAAWLHWDSIRELHLPLERSACYPSLNHTWNSTTSQMGLRDFLFPKQFGLRTLEENKKKESQIYLKSIGIFFHLQWTSAYAEVQQMVPVKFILGISISANPRFNQAMIFQGWSAT